MAIEDEVREITRLQRIIRNLEQQLGVVKQERNELLRLLTPEVRSASAALARNADAHPAACCWKCSDGLAERDRLKEQVKTLTQECAALDIEVVNWQEAVTAMREMRPQMGTSPMAVVATIAFLQMDARRLCAELEEAVSCRDAAEADAAERAVRETVIGRTREKAGFLRGTERAIDIFKMWYCDTSTPGSSIEMVLNGLREFAKQYGAVGDGDAQ